ncbi:hypothetical protein C0J52_06180 [Blattella germanica]|nr:hypothetical protein C0J52_06180 [Blattella germanica]
METLYRKYRTGMVFLPCENFYVPATKCSRRSLFHKSHIDIYTLRSVFSASKEKQYELDLIAQEKGHRVVRLPPYHCQYNPIELIWAQVKGYVAERNNTFKMADIEVLLNEAINSITIAAWEKCVKHAEKLQEDDFAKEIARDDILEPIVVNLEESDCSDSDSGESSD